MKYLSLLLLFLIACGSPPVEPEGCIINQEVENQGEFEDICIESLRCIKDGAIIFSNYLCICDGTCICFFSILSDCESVYEDTCEKEGSMLILPGDFCLTPGKREILKGMFEQVNESFEKGE